MTTDADLLGRPPIFKPQQEVEPQPDDDWRGERFLKVRRNEGGGNAFTMSNAVRQSYKTRKFRI